MAIQGIWHRSREVKRMNSEEAMKILAKLWKQGDEEDKLTADELFAIQDAYKYIRDNSWHEIKSASSLPPLYTEVLTVDCEGKYRVMTLECHKQYESWKGGGASGVNAMLDFRFTCSVTGEEAHADDILAWKPIEEYEPKTARSGAVWSKSRDYRDEKNEDGWIEYYGEGEE